MSDVKSGFKQCDIIVCVSNDGVVKELTTGNEYMVQDVNNALGEVLLYCDIGKLAWYYSSRFKLKEEEKVNKVEKEQYIEHFTGRVYDLVFKGNRTYVLRCVSDDQEVCCYESHLKSIFTPLTKEMQKQQKKNEDLGVLANVTDEIRKLLDDNHVICHANVNRDTKGLVEYNIMLGENV